MRAFVWIAGGVAAAAALAAASWLGRSSNGRGVAFNDPDHVLTPAEPRGSSDAQALGDGIASVPSQRNVVEDSGSLTLALGPGGPFDVSRTALDNDVYGYFATREATVELYLLRERTDRILRNSRWHRGATDIAVLESPSNAESAASCVWVTHPAMQPRVVVIDDDGRPVDSLATAVAAESAWITVKNREGAVVEGAYVVQQALPLSGFDPPRADMRERARRALVRDGRTDGSGRVARIPMGGPSAIEIVHGDERRRLITDGSQRDVVVDLGGSFRIEGRVSGADGLGPWATVAVRVAEGPRVGVVAAANLGPDGTFGPLDVALQEGATVYAVRLDHGEVVPQEHLVVSPVAGATVRVEFHVETGRRLWAQVLDLVTQEPVHGACVRWTWESGGHAENSTGIEGYADACLPPVLADVEVEAPGYARYAARGIDAADPSVPDILVLELERPGRIEGEVVFGASGPTGFLVQHGPDDGRALTGVEKYPDAQAGTFALEGVSPGIHLLQGILADRTPTALVSVDVEAGATTKVRLVPIATASASGQVIDAGTGEPIADARLISMVMGGQQQPLVTLEDAWRTGVDGRFHVTGLPLERAGLLADVDGYARYQFVLPALDASRFNDVGIIALEPLIAREVRLGEQADDPAAYGAGPRVGEIVPFDSTRRVRISSTPSDEGVLLRHPDGVVDHYLLYASQRLDATLTCMVEPRRLRIDLTSADGPLHGHRGVVELTWVDPQGITVMRRVAGSWRECLDLPGIVGDRIHVVATSDDRTARSMRLLERGHGRFELDFDAPPLTVQVVDAEGAPLVNAEVSIDATEGQEFHGQQTEFTDEFGVAQFAATRSPAAWVGVRTAEGHELVQRRIERNDTEQPIVVRLGHVRPLRVRLTEDGRPRANVPWAVTALVGPYRARHGVTGIDGRLETPNLTQDPVVLELRPPGAWRLSVLVVADGDWLELEARHPVDITFRVIDDKGAPVGGAMVRLVHTAIDQYDRTHGHLGGDVAAWMGAGLVPAVDLVTGLDGALELRALPEGTYRCRVEAGSRYVEAEILLTPGNQAPVVVVLS